MIICLAVLWVSSAVANPIHGEIEFDQFRQLKIREIQEQLRLVQEDPLDAIEYFNLGLAYMAVGRHRKEIGAYLEAMMAMVAMMTAKAAATPPPRQGGAHVRIELSLIPDQAHAVSKGSST